MEKLENKCFYASFFSILAEVILFKIFNVFQTLWLSHALINKWILRARDYNFYPHGPTHSWVGVYAQGIPNTLPLSGEW